MVETVRGGLSRRPAPAVFCPGPALREGPAEPFLPRVQSWKRRPRGRGGGGRGRVQTGLWSVRAGSVWRAALGCLSPEPKNPLPRSGLGGEYASAGTQQARVRKPPTGAPGWGSCDRAAGESSGWAWVEGPLQTTNTQPHTVSLPLCHGAPGAGSRRPRRSSPDVPGSEALNRAPVGPPRWGRALQPALPRWAPARVSGGPGEASPAVPGVRGPGAGPAPMGPVPGVRRTRGGLPGRPGGSGASGSGPAPMGPVPGVRGPGPGVRRTRGGLPGRPGGQGPRVGPCPDGPRPGCPGRLPRPSRGSGAPGRVGPGPPLPSSRLPFPEGPRPGCPAGPGSPPRPSRGVRGPGPGVRGMLPRPSRGSGAPGRALPRWAPSRVSGGGFPGRPGGQGPRVGPCPDGPRPGCPGRLPRTSRGSGAPGRALPRWAPSRVSGGGFPGRPGGQGPRVGPCPDGPRPGCPGRLPRTSRGSGATGRALPRWAPSRVSGGGFPGRPGGQGPRVGPCPEGPRPRCPGPRVGPCPDGPRPGCPGRLPRTSRGSGAPGRALPRWAPSRVSGEASQDVPGVRGPGSGPAPMGPLPGVRGRLPRPSRGSGAPGRALPRRAPAQVSGAPGRALPRWAPSRVSGEASQAVAGVRGPGSGPAPMGPGPGVRGPGSGPAPMGPVPGVRGGFPGRPGGRGPRVGPCPDGPRPRCPGPRVGPCPDGPPSRVSGEASQAVPGVRGPGSGPPLLQPALPRWAPGRAGPPSLPCPDGPRPVPRGPRRLRELRQSASRWPPSEPGHLASPRTRGIWSPSALICYGASRWPGCPGSPDEGSFAPSCPARAPGGRVRSRRRSPPSPGAHQLPGRAQIFLRITRDRVRRTPSWSGGPVVLDRAPRARVARPPPRTLVRRVSPPKLAAQRADCRPGSSQHRTPIDWAHLVRLGMDCLASLGCCFKQRASNPARDRPTRGPAVSRKALPGRAKAKQPGSLRPPSGPTRVERGRVAPGPGNPPPPRRSGHPSAVARLLLHPAHFPQQLGTTVPWGVPAGPGRQAPPASPAQAAPRPGRLHPAEAAGARRFPCDRPVQGGPRRARGYSPQQGASPKALGCLPERNTPQAQGPALALAHPWLAERSAAAGAPGREDRARVRAPPARRTRPSREGGTGEREGGARARASPAPDPPGAARRKSQAPPETEPTPTRHDPGRVNRIVVPPWAWTTPESPAVPGRQGGLGEEEPGPAREPRLRPTRAGGWASPGRLARLGAARLGTGDSRPRRADGRRAGGAETPPSLPGTLARRPGRGFRRLARLLPVLREGPAAAGLPGPRAAPGNAPLARVVGGEAPGPSAWKRSWNRGG
ncbi:hypothetical protein NDU88_000806 [Pleurodeles waltl]|uniref:Uncharacterized protein n=1 Tax=Pleurodeles waltl TaxID=8319 RepID=A0AAV7U620_PLEWA|nr:hypothetical protein NDU88_000806 [Pleurodeles waltl]